MTLRDFGQLALYGFEMGTNSGSTVTYDECYDSNRQCELTLAGNSVTCGAKTSWSSLFSSVTCSFVGTSCVPDTAVVAYVPEAGTGSDGRGGSTGDELGGTGSEFSLIFGTLPDATGRNCATMFASGAFAYPRAQTALSFRVGTPELLGTRWSCSILGGDLCGTAWDAADSVLSKFGYTLQYLTDSVLEPFRKAVGYMGTPEKGKSYCYLGKTVTYYGKADTYVSHINGAHTVNVSGKTGIDWLIIILLFVGVYHFIIRR